MTTFSIIVCVFLGLVMVVWFIGFSIFCIVELVKPFTPHNLRRSIHNANWRRKRENDRMRWVLFFHDMKVKRKKKNAASTSAALSPGE